MSGNPSQMAGDNKHLKDMHVVSQVLLRRFADTVTGKLVEYNLRYGKTRPRPPKGVG
jgi:hypothetical protein